jgi:hypothetical protein
VSLTVGLGGSAGFSVAATGTEPLQYQWRLNGNAIPGATDTSLSFTNVQPANAGNYRVIVRNDIGLDASVLVTLTLSNLNLLPFADNFTNAGSLGSTTNGNGFGANLGATLEPGEPNPDPFPGGASVWVSWQAPVNGLATFTTAGSDFDTILAVYTNAISTPVALTNLGLVVDDDDSAAFLCSLLSFSAVAGQTYFIQVDGYRGATGNINLSWSLAPTTNPPPEIVLQPQGQTVIAGSNVTLSVAIAAGPEVSYQWYSNSVPLPGATDSSLTLSPAQAGIYQVAITNVQTLAGLLSDPADIQIILPGPGQRGNPVNVRAEDKFLTASALTPTDPNIPHDPASASGFTDVQTFPTITATAEPGEPNHCGNPPCHSVWNSFSNQLGGTLTISTLHTTFNAVLEAYTGPGDSFATLVEVACSANHGAAGETVTFPYTGGTTLWVVVDGVNCASGNVTLSYNLVATPAFTAAPLTQTISNGGALTLTAAVVGAPTLSYQWQFNGSNIAGATSTLFVLPRFLSGNEGNYSVVASNNYGAVTSLPAQLFLNNPRFLNPSRSGTSFASTFVGIANTSYVIEASSDLLRWTPVKTNSSAVGVFNFTDPATGGLSSRFYRARQR